MNSENKYSAIVRALNPELPEGVNNSIDLKICNTTFWGLNTKDQKGQFELQIGYPQDANACWVGNTMTPTKMDKRIELLQLDITECFVCPFEFGVSVIEFLEDRNSEEKLQRLFQVHDKFNKYVQSRDIDLTSVRTDIRISEDMYAAYSEQYSAVLDLNGNEEPWSDEGLYKFITEKLGTEYWEVV